jgi:dTMP kinase
MPEPRHHNGIFLTLEGGEGAGKSTLAKALGEMFATLGREIVLTREPGGSPFAERLRELILSGSAKAAGPFAEALLFSAARMDHLETLIRPALRRGAIVICDRFSDSTRAYQGALGRIDRSLLRSLENVTLDGTLPDLTLMLDVPPEAGLARAAARRGTGDADRFEAERIGFHRRLRQAFLDIAAAEPERCIVIDASQPPNDVLEMAWAACEARLLPSADHDAPAHDAPANGDVRS